jgi:hypothetical protein
MVEQLYKQQIGRLNTNRGDIRKALPGYQKQAMGQLASIYGQNQGQTKALGREISSSTSAAQALLAQALQGLMGDLGGQGVDASALQGAGQMYNAEAGARGAAASGFNNRLAQVMATGYGDQRSGATAIHQGAMSQADLQYQAALAELQQQRAAQLMGLV